MRDLPSTLPDGWTTKRLGALAKVTSGGTPRRAIAEYWGGNVPWVTTGEIDFNTIKSTDEHITEAGVANSSAKVFPAGTLLMAMFGQGVTRGKVATLGVDGAFNQACVAIVPKDGLATRYLYQFLAHRYQHIRALANTGSQANLNAALIRGLDVIVPPKQEAPVIASIGDTYDRATDRISRLIRARRKLKRGLLQQLLTGLRRFPEFRKQPWVEVPIADLLREEERYVKWSDDDEYRLVSVRRRSGGFFDRERKRGKDIMTKTLKITRTGDFVLARMQVLHGAMTVTPPEFDGAHISDSYMTFVPRDSKTLWMPFFGYLSTTPLMYHKAFTSSFGVAIEKMTFHPRWWLTERVRVPQSVDEQKKIADVLHACDHELALLRTLHDALKEQKKGLMQKLLTGQVRVPASMLKEASHA